MYLFKTFPHFEPKEHCIKNFEVLESLKVSILKWQKKNFPDNLDKFSSIFFTISLMFRNKD